MIPPDRTTSDPVQHPGSADHGGFPRPPRCLGLDIGSRTVGVAMSDPLGLTAQPLEVIRYRAWKEVERRLEQLVRLHGVNRLVIGYPRRTDGRIGPEAERVQGRAVRLRQRLGLPYDLWDERLTTVAAERALLEGDVRRRRRREVIDQTAAAIMLQSYLDAQRSRARRGVPRYGEVGGPEDQVRASPGHGPGVGETGEER